MNHSVSQAIDKLIEDQERRHAWLFKAGEQCRRWREEDRETLNTAEDR